MITEFNDNHKKPIIAFDFDGCITRRNIYPDIDKLRPHAKEVINFLYDIGVIVVIWTCREDYTEMYSVVNGLHKHMPLKTNAKQYLDDNGIRFHTVNSVIEYAPFPYESRKIYANMYVDDMAYGWQESDDVMVRVLDSFLNKILHIPYDVRMDLIYQIENNERMMTADEFWRRVKKHPDGTGARILY